LPASMWAMIPMLRVLASGNCRIRGASAMCFLHAAGLRNAIGLHHNAANVRFLPSSDPKVT
jgi:hypothetical protein